MGWQGSLDLGSGDGRIVLTVTDSGPGIPPDLLPKVFEPYVTTRTTGLGLGLAIARRIVEAHGGAIWIEDAPGGGALFRVILPASWNRRPGLPQEAARTRPASDRTAD